MHVPVSHFLVLGEWVLEGPTHVGALDGDTGLVLKVHTQTHTHTHIHTHTHTHAHTHTTHTHTHTIMYSCVFVGHSAD